MRDEAKWRLWIALVLFATALLVAFVVGVVLIPAKPSGPVLFGLSDSTRSQLGASLVGGAVVGLAVLGAELAFAWQLEHLELVRARGADRQGMRLQLGLSTEFSGIDLALKDLSRFYLPDRNFYKANLSGCILQGAILWNANLSNARLIAANLRDADLNQANLTNANLTRADLRGAFLFRANLEGATSVARS